MTQRYTLDSILASLSEDLEGTTSVEKQASEAGNTKETQQVSSTAQELEDLLKEANTNEVNTEMSNVNEKGRKIAEDVLSLIKSAMDAAGANQVVTQTSAQAASSSAGLAETPREGVSVTGTLKGLVANGLANGAVREDALDENVDKGGDESTGGHSGMHTSDGHSVDAVHANDEVEKAAAVVALIDQGVDFDTAVDLVKQAAAEIEEEEFEQVKQAAVACLVEEGMDIESAVVLVKQAMDVDVEQVKKANEDKEAWKATGRAIGRSAAEGLAGGAAGAGLGAAIGAGVAKATKKAVKPAAALGAMIGYHGGAISGSLHGTKTSIKNTMSKKAAALEALVQSGYSTAEALELLDNQ